MPIECVIFDFDGLILETEEPLFVAWQECYLKHGQELTFQQWADCVGTVGVFEPMKDLQARLARRLDVHTILGEVEARHHQMLAGLEMLPGVRDHVAMAKRMGLSLGVASSSSYRWVNDHLDRLGLLESFSYLACYDELGPARAKPAPDLYLEVLEHLATSPPRALALEDSANGIKAAKAAGIRCVAVPTQLTRALDLSLADLVISSLADVTLPQLIGRLEDEASSR